MKKSPKPFAKTATVYRSPKFVFLEALSGSHALTYREKERHPVYLDPEATNEALGEALLAALDRSRAVDGSDKEFYDGNRAFAAYETWEKEFMSRYGYKTKRDAYSRLDWCLVKVEEGQISMQPRRRHKPQQWKSLPPENTVVVPATRDAPALGAALWSALERCE